jgi:hypothetical protein
LKGTGQLPDGQSASAVSMAQIELQIYVPGTALNFTSRIVHLSKVFGKTQWISFMPICWCCSAKHLFWQLEKFVNPTTSKATLQLSLENL